MYYLLTESAGMNTSSPTSMACSSSFSITRPRYLTWRSVMMAAALAYSFLGEDCLASVSGSLTTIANFFLLLKDWIDDSEDALFSEGRKLFTTGFENYSSCFLETALWLFESLPIIETQAPLAKEMPWKVLEECTFWALVRLAVASCSSPILS